MEPQSRVRSDDLPVVDDPIRLAQALMTAIAMFGHAIGRLAPNEAPDLIDYVDRTMKDAACRRRLSAKDIQKLAGAIDMARGAAQGKGFPT